ncbi:phytanoyl-CoA dioxygenase family protein [Paenibacillus sp. BC26]|uniref:phytanoyl-CoA dioxygenase family protein n=1 Tax=Paenibacillus sp. BC26 TaxID=1881032 RepID=UPI0008F30AB2|nr:phytanoyl-CoA dioxygenase family protein [Paenibacillus sp. BC26]SFS46656.1 Ectoine hydroxylase-related dioxygenase, phytanoyl-CoA dioxygenase (PhyH) family [Paenibacillus sp. BC26]
MKIHIGQAELEMGSKYMTELRSANDILDNVEELRERLEEDGYLLIRGFHKREDVMKARSGILNKLNGMGRLDSEFPIEDGVIAAGAKGVMFGGAANDEDQDMQGFYNLVNNSNVMGFFDRLLGGESITYDYKWPRAVGNGDFTGAHYDIVYMGRGTKQVYTMWTPLGDVPYEQGPLAICLGSQHFDKMKSTYGQMDVDRDNIELGWISKDPVECVEKFGGQWATTPFEAGDMIIFGMFLLHGSVNNMTNRYRLSSDTRYQLKSEPVDERWVGVKPKGHYAWGKEKSKSIEEARKEWNI